jgi:hypothetical protein
MRALADPTGPTAGGDLAESALARLSEALAILEAIDRGELLGELPAAAEAAERHQCAVSLLAVLRRELEALACELQSASYVEALIARLGRPSRRAADQA